MFFQLFIAFSLIALAAVAVVSLRTALVLSRLETRVSANGKPLRRGTWDRMRYVYFQKERRAREIRARRRATEPPRTARPAADASAPNAPAPPPKDDLLAYYCAVLDLREPLDADTVRQAYKARILEYHPDRVATLGVKLQRLAEDETKRINEAYAYLRKRVGL